MGGVPPLGKVSFLSAPEGDCFLMSNWENIASVAVFLVTCPRMSAIHPLTTVAVNVQEFAMVLFVLKMQSATILLGIFEESGKAVWSRSDRHLEMG